MKAERKRAIEGTETVKDNVKGILIVKALKVFRDKGSRGTETTMPSMILERKVSPRSLKVKSEIKY